MKYCPHCGAAIAVSAASFCPTCGKKLSTPSSRPRQNSQKKKRRPQTQKNSPPTRRRSVNDGYDGYYRDTPVADGGQVRTGMDPALAKKIALLVVGVALIIALSVLAMYFL